MVTLATTNTEYKSWASADETIISLEKAQSGRTTLDDIVDALDEYKRLFIAGLSSPGEKITLSRAYPDNIEYSEACEALKNDDGEDSIMIVGGPASVDVVDREGHLITTDALKKAFKKYMDNFRGRNVMVMHSDVQVGHALPAYISKSGNIFKSGVDDKGLFVISELRDDTRIANRVRDQIEKGGMKSYSIAGSATQSKQINKSDGSDVLQVDDMELAEITICEKGVNQGAHFELLKGDKAEGSCADGSCLTKSEDTTPQPEIIAISKEDIPSFGNLFKSWISKDLTPLFADQTGLTERQYRTARRLATERPKTMRDLRSQIRSAQGGDIYVDPKRKKGGMESRFKDAFLDPTKMHLGRRYDEAMADPNISEETKQKLHVEMLGLTNPQSIYFSELNRDKVRALDAAAALDAASIPVWSNLHKESKDEDTSRAVAIATAQAKKEGYKKFTDGSPGDKRRDKIAEEIKKSIKKAFLRKDNGEGEREVSSLQQDPDRSRRIWTRQAIKEAEEAGKSKFSVPGGAWAKGRETQVIPEKQRYYFETAPTYEGVRYTKDPFGSGHISNITPDKYGNEPTYDFDPEWSDYLFSPDKPIEQIGDVYNPGYFTSRPRREAFEGQTEEYLQEKSIIKDTVQAFLRKDEWSDKSGDKPSSRERRSMDKIERELQSFRESNPYHEEWEFPTRGGSRYIVDPDTGKESDVSVSPEQLGIFYRYLDRNKPYWKKVSSIPQIQDLQYGTITYPSTSLAEPKSESRVPFPSTYTLDAEDPNTGIIRQTRQKLTENITDEEGFPYLAPYYKVPISNLPSRKKGSGKGVPEQSDTGTVVDPLSTSKALFLDKLKELV